MPLAVVVQGFFLGMVANLFPLAPAGVGAVDAGMIGAFVLFGLPEAAVFPAILIYRLVAFWLPIPPGSSPSSSSARRSSAGRTRGCRSTAAPDPPLGAVDRSGTLKSKVLDSRRKRETTGND